MDKKHYKPEENVYFFVTKIKKKKYTSNMMSFIGLKLRALTKADVAVHDLLDD